MLIYHINEIMKKSLIRKVAYLEGNNVVIFYFFVASETWPDKKGFPVLRGTIW
jgi:hypothetical protein